MQEILYNTCFGVFRLPFKVVLDVFKRNLPGTPRGDKLFGKCKVILTCLLEAGETPDPAWTRYSEIVSKKKLAGMPGWHLARVHTWMKSPKGQGFVKVGADELLQNAEGELFSLQDYECGIPEETRSAPEFIDAVRRHGLLGKLKDDTKIGIARVPVDCDWDIDEFEDHVEQVRAVPPLKQVLRDLMEIARGKQQQEQEGQEQEKPLHPATRKLLDGSLDLDAFLRPLAECDPEFDEDADLKSERWCP